MIEINKKLLLVFLNIFYVLHAADIQQGYSPPNILRTQTIWKWCDCGKGINSVQIWPNYQI